MTDFETRSEADLKRVGAWEYSLHPSTQILCVAWRIGTRETLAAAKTHVKQFSPVDVPGNYGEWKRALLDPSVMLISHNSLFEQVIVRHVLPKYIFNEDLKTIPTERWICTASLARALALPGKLEHVCDALKLPHQKDMEGHRLMLKLSKPRKPSKHNPSLWFDDEDEHKRVADYCKADIDAETALFLRLPSLSPAERKLWLLDQKINFRGFRIDRPLVKQVLKMIGVEKTRLEREAFRLTDGAIRSTKQHAATLKWLQQNGCYIPNLQKKTLTDAVSARLARGKALDLIRVRQAASMTSTGKYVGLEARSRTDGRIRDALMYHGASTGRWNSVGAQVHNFPAGTIDEPELACEVIKGGDLEEIRMLYGEPMVFFSKCLKAMIRASLGKKLFGGDFSSIELRTLFWLARHERGLKAIRDGRDLYCDQATDVYGRKITKANYYERQLGKKAVLGAGFQLGPDGFVALCEKDGMKVEPELAERAIRSYRKRNQPVVAMWGNLERAAIAAVKNPGKKYTINRTSWFVRGEYLWCELPSGRRLAYYGPRIKMRATKWGTVKPTLHYWAVHPKTKKWVFEGTYGGKLTENVTQATARDIMAASMERVEDAGYNIMFTVHDDILGESGNGSEKVFRKLMLASPEWAEGLPVNVEEYSGKRYA